MPNMWWQIPPSGKIFHSAVGRNLADLTEFQRYRFFGIKPARAKSDRAIKLECSMGIFSRTRDIFAANMTELLDRAEDPARMIRMIILEMEETLVEVRASAARSIADSKEMKRALIRLEDLQLSWTEKAELALSKDREDLAKAALLERQKAADMADGLKAELAAIEDTLKGYEADIAKLQGKLREARSRQNAIATRIESAVTRARTREMLNGGRTEDAFSRFEQLERRADFAEGRADALGMTGPKSLEEEIADLKATDKVDAELEAMKAALKARGA
jgi:phage shock protein A